ncbi:MAG: RlmE family RNA methyltransferase [bacterium]|nr:RlmE family RNA methyltransferase [bacterium]
MKEVQDHYFKKAKAEGFAARSAYKLEEIDQKQSLFRPGFKVLDLGCFPGSWMQYTAQKIGPKGMVLGVDIQDLQLALKPNMAFIHADILELDLERLKEFGAPFDLVLSDMAPKTTGHKHTDGARVLGLCEMALFASKRWLRTGGNCLIKAFHGPAFEPLLNQMKREYNKVKTFKPKSSRKESKEVFLLGLGKHKPEESADDDHFIG